MRTSLKEMFLIHYDRSISMNFIRSIFEFFLFYFHKKNICENVKIFYDNVIGNVDRYQTLKSGKRNTSENLLMAVIRAMNGSFDSNLFRLISYNSIIFKSFNSLFKSRSIPESTNGLQRPKY